MYHTTGYKPGFCDIYLNFYLVCPNAHTASKDACQSICHSGVHVPPMQSEGPLLCTRAIKGFPFKVCNLQMSILNVG